MAIIRTTTTSSTSVKPASSRCDRVVMVGISVERPTALSGLRAPGYSR
jgi:hypothetical protein